MQGVEAIIPLKIHSAAAEATRFEQCSGSGRTQPVELPVVGLVACLGLVTRPPLVPRFAVDRIHPFAQAAH
jgi:hypothetical protein